MKKSLAIALICIFFSFAASAAEQFVFLSQKGNDVYFLLDCIISDSTEFYRPMQVNKGSSFVCFFNLTDIEHEVYSAKPRFEGKSFVKNTSVCYVAMVLHKGNWYVGRLDGRKRLYSYLHIL